MCSGTHTFREFVEVGNAWRLLHKVQTVALVLPREVHSPSHFELILCRIQYDSGKQIHIPGIHRKPYFFIPGMVPSVFIQSSQHGWRKPAKCYYII